MRVVMTAMVRDEADIIRPMLEHHIAQGVDQFVITDNGSIDGTTEILEEYAGQGVVDLRHDPVHRKQQGVTVTKMAREAYSVHHATWVVNADADEFWLPIDRSRSLHSALAETSPEVGAFEVPVIDMTGAPALTGSGLSRLRFRDTRPVDMLQSIGLHAHATADVVHIGSAEIEVVQGNHFVNIPSSGNPEAGNALEVLHFPWRSWNQFERKVENAGRAYENDSGLTPSPNHHGMRDWRRHVAGSLFALYVARHPSAEQIREGMTLGHYREDDTLADLQVPVGDVLIDDAVADETRRTADAVLSLEQSLSSSSLTAARQAEVVAHLEEELRLLRAVERSTRVDLASTRRGLRAASAELDAVRRRKVVRIIDRISLLARRS